MKKKSMGKGQAGGSVPVHLAAIESDVFLRLPNIVAHCCLTRYDDGDPRRPGWITVKTLGGTWMVQAKDPDSQAQLGAVGNTLDDALALMDLLLGADDAPWEPDPFAKRMNGKK